MLFLIAQVFIISNDAVQSVAAVYDRFRLFSPPFLVHKVCCHLSEYPPANGFKNAESFEDGTIILIIKIRFLTINLKFKQFNSKFS